VNSHCRQIDGRNCSVGEDLAGIHGGSLVVGGTEGLYRQKCSDAEVRRK